MLLCSSPPWTFLCLFCSPSPRAVGSSMLKGRKLKCWLRSLNYSLQQESRSQLGWESGTWQRAECPQVGQGGRLLGRRLQLPWLPTAAGWQGRCWPGSKWEAVRLAAPGLLVLKETGPQRPVASEQQKLAVTIVQGLLLPSSHNLLLEKIYLRNITGCMIMTSTQR